MNKKKIKKAARILLGGALAFAGISHLSFARKAFRSQAPGWVPFSKDFTVLASGVVEIALGGALVLTDEAHQGLVGKIAATFFTAVFPGNISQLANHRDAFGLDSDSKRFARLFIQPVLIYWSIKSTESE